MPSLKPEMISGRASSSSSSTAMEEPNLPEAIDIEMGCLSPPSTRDGEISPSENEIRFGSKETSKSGSSGADATGSFCQATTLAVKFEKSDDYDHARDNPDRKPKLSSALIMYVQLTFRLALFTFALPTSLEYTEKIGGSKKLAGLMLGLVGISSAIFKWPGLLLMEAIGIKKSQMVSNAITALGCAMYSLCYWWDSVGLLFVSRFIQGMGVGFSTQFFSRVVGINFRSKYFLMVNVFIGIGYGVGALLGAAMIAAFNHVDADEHKIFNKYTAPGWLMMVIYVLLIFATWFFCEEPLLETAEVRARKEKEFHRNLSRQEKAIRKEQRRLEQEADGQGFSWSELFGLVMNLVICTLCPIMLACLGFYTFGISQKTWEWSMEHSALYVAGVMLSLVPITLAAGWAFKKWKFDDRKVSLILFIVSLVASVCFFDFFQGENHAVADIVVWTIGYVICSCCFQICIAAGKALITKQVPTHFKKHFNVAMSSVVYCGHGTGSFIGGLFRWDQPGVQQYEGLSPDNVFAIFMTVALAFLVVVVVVAYPHLKPHRNAT